jgi:hypothetical protein
MHTNQGDAPGPFLSPLFAHHFAFSISYSSLFIFHSSSPPLQPVFSFFVLNSSFSVLHLFEPCFWLHLAALPKAGKPGK